MGDAEGKVESAMMGLNEKLDKIRVKPNALLQVLDVLFAALKKLNLQGGPKRRKFHNEDHMDVEMPSDWEGEEEDDEEEYESDPGDLAGYDIAVGDQGTTSYSMAEIRERGLLHQLAESARKVCEDFQTGASGDLQNPYMWFRVVSKPMLLAVQIQFEVAGMMNDRIAAGLGLTFKEPVSLNLEFSKNLWAETSFRKEKLSYERVTATQNPLPSKVDTEHTLDDIDRFLETSSGDKHRSYGLEVIFPELTSRFFAHLNQESTSESVHLDGIENVKRKSTNPFICLALYISDQLKLLPAGAWCAGRSCRPQSLACAPVTTTCVCTDSRSWGWGCRFWTKCITTLSLWKWSSRSLSRPWKAPATCSSRFLDFCWWRIRYEDAAAGSATKPQNKGVRMIHGKTRGAILLWEGPLPKRDGRTSVLSC